MLPPCPDDPVIPTREDSDGTSAQLGYTVPFSLWKTQDRRQIKTTDTTETKDTQK